MILAMILFGLNLDPLLNAIAEVESNNGKRSSNVYQISDAYVKDCNRIVIQSGCRLAAPFRVYDKVSRFKSRCMIECYWYHYGKQYYRDNGTLPTIEVLARIHNGGPDGYKKTSTLKYWQRIKKYL